MSALLVANTIEHDGAVAWEQKVCFKVDRKNVLQSSRCTLSRLIIASRAPASNGVTCSVRVSNCRVARASANLNALTYEETHSVL
jgi:hypothetical protein